jgi:ABC-2 type transport system permease protein
MYSEQAFFRTGGKSADCKRRVIDMLKTVLHYLRLYCLLEIQYVKSRMNYRADFIISSIGMLFSNVTSLVVFWVLFQSIPRLEGWTFDEILFIYGFYLLAVSPAQIFFDNIWQLHQHIMEGTFIKYYFRPLNMLFYYLSERVDLKGFAQVAIGVVVFTYASNRLELMWTSGRVLLFCITLFSASLVVISLLVIASCVTFWTVRSFSLLELAFRLREFSQYPTTIFDGFFRFLFTYIIPIGFVAFYPSLLLLKPQEASWLVYLSPVVGGVLFAVAYRVWIWGVNSYTGTGS